MSKSKGNQYTLRDILEKGYDPLAVRYLLQSVHYRKQLNFTFEGVEQAQSALQRINDFLVRIREVSDEIDENRGLSGKITQARVDCEAWLDEDLNTSGALGVLFDLIKQVNVSLECREVGSANRDQILSLITDVNRVLAVFQVETPVLEDQEITNMIEQREQARLQNDYQRADEIRDALVQQGITLEDTQGGTRWKRLI